MKKKIVIPVLILAAAGIAWFLFSRDADGSKQPSADSAPETFTVEKGNLLVLVETSGRVVPNEEVEIKCKASGEVTKLPVDVSDMVKKGDLLVQLNPDDEERSVKRAEVNLAVSEAKCMQSKLNLQVAENDLVTETSRANAELLSAQAKVNESKSKYERLTQLLDKKMASKEECESANALYAQSVYNLANVRARLEDLKTQNTFLESKKQDILIAEAQVQSDSLSLSDARERLKDTTVIAPMDGVVAQRSIQEGTIIASGINNVGGGTTMMTLIDMSRIFVLAFVDESDIGRIQSGQSARITVDAYPDMVFPGEVVRVATKGSTESSVVTFEVKIEVKGKQRQLLKPEMTANVEVVAVEKNDVLLIPVTAMERRRGNTFVTVQNPASTSAVQRVTIGDSDGEMIEITDGLAVGDIISLGNADRMSRWQGGDSDDRDARRKQRMQMRMMSGGGRR